MNPKYAIFHLVDKSLREWCYILTNTCHDFCTLTIPAMEDHKRKGDQVAALFAKWFKPATLAQATDAYWDPKDECIKT